MNSTGDDTSGSDLLQELVDDALHSLLVRIVPRAVLCRILLETRNPP